MLNNHMSSSAQAAVELRKLKLMPRNEWREPMAVVQDMINQTLAELREKGAVKKHEFLTVNGEAGPSQAEWDREMMAEERQPPEWMQS